jgi:hypothetical protein
MTDKTHDLQQLISMSRTMLEKAREECWDMVNVLEAERSELISKFFSEPVQQDYADAVADGVQSIIAINCDIIALGALSRLNLAHTLQNMDQGKKAIKAYAS